MSSKTQVVFSTAVKWILFAMELVLLFFANNTLFMVPERYDWFTGISVGIAITAAAICAWFSSRRFARDLCPGRTRLKNVVMAPPNVIWVFVISVFAAVSFIRK